MDSDTLARRSLRLALCAVALSACGGRSSLLDIDTWLATRDSEETSPGQATGGHEPIPLDPAHNETCGKGLRGPLMVPIVVPESGSFCIDSTEVTNLHYRAFLQAGFPLDPQSALCGWNKDYTPAWWEGRPADNWPVIGVDWCDARAYCAWAGKRLCGKVGGGNIYSAYPPLHHPVDPLEGEWTYACTAGGTLTFPYGNVYDATACVTQTYDGDLYFTAGDHIRPVREATRCGGGFAGLYDMGGNATEWVDSSNREVGESDIANRFGASYVSYSLDSLGTNCTAYGGATRDSQSGDTGIRCCKDGP